MLGVEAERGAPVVEGFHAGEKPRVQVDRVAMRGELRRVLRVDLLQDLVTVGAEQHIEDALRAPQHGAGPLERLDGVGERRWIGLAGNAVDLRQFLAHPLVEGGTEVVVANLIEARNAVRQRAWLQ